MRRSEDPYPPYGISWKVDFLMEGQTLLDSDAELTEFQCLPIRGALQMLAAQDLETLRA